MKTEKKRFSFSSLLFNSIKVFAGKASLYQLYNSFSFVLWMNKKIDHCQRTLWCGLVTLCCREKSSPRACCCGKFSIIFIKTTSMMRMQNFFYFWSRKLGKKKKSLCFSFFMISWPQTWCHAKLAWMHHNHKLSGNLMARHKHNICKQKVGGAKSSLNNLNN